MLLRRDDGVDFEHPHRELVNAQDATAVDEVGVGPAVTDEAQKVQSPAPRLQEVYPQGSQLGGVRDDPPAAGSR